jgi:glc operon protein GlcG
MLTLEDANRITAAAKRTAAQNNWNLVIAVVDDGGFLVSLERMDGSQKASVAVAQQKARVAILYQRPTKEFEERLLSGNLGVLSLPDIICSEGGVPIIRDGVCVGAIGVSGAKSFEDGLVAASGLSALNIG